MTKATIPGCYDGATYSSYRAWIQIRFFAYGTKCWAKSVTLLYQNNKYFDTEGVRINTHAFGNLRDVDYLDYMGSYGISPTKYIGDLTYALELTKKFKRGINMFGAPYDWRFPIHESHGLNRLKSLIEKAYNLNNGKKVIILAHSQGTARSMWLLNNHVDTEWRNKYIDRFIAVNGVFGGSFKAIKGVVSGYPELLSVNVMGYNTTLVEASIVRDIFRSMGSAVTLQPNKLLYGLNHTTLSYQPSPKAVKDGLRPQSFTLGNYTSILPDLANNLKERMEEDRTTFERALLTDPGVPVQCMWSIYNEPTTDVRFQYIGDNATHAYSKDPSPFTTFGDNTVSLRSTSICSRFGSTKGSWEFRGMDHQAILKEPLWIAFMVDLLQRSPSGAILPDDMDSKVSPLPSCEDCGNDDDVAPWDQVERKKLFLHLKGIKQFSSNIDMSVEKQLEDEKEISIGDPALDLDKHTASVEELLPQALSAVPTQEAWATVNSARRLSKFPWTRERQVHKDKNDKKNDEHYVNLSTDDSPNLDPRESENKNNPCLIYQTELLVPSPDNPDLHVPVNDFVKPGDFIDAIDPNSLQGRAVLFRTCIHSKRSVLTKRHSSMPALKTISDSLRNRAEQSEVVTHLHVDTAANVRANALAESAAIRMKLEEYANLLNDRTQNDHNNIVNNMAGSSGLQFVVPEMHELRSFMLQSGAAHSNRIRSSSEVNFGSKNISEDGDTNEEYYHWDILLPTAVVHVPRVAVETESSPFAAGHQDQNEKQVHTFKSIRV